MQRPPPLFMKKFQKKPVFLFRGIDFLSIQMVDWKHFPFICLLFQVVGEVHQNHKRKGEAKKYIVCPNWKLHFSLATNKITVFKCLAWDLLVKFFFLPHLHILHKNLISSQQKKSWQGVKSAFFISPKTKKLPEHTEQQIWIKKIKHITFSVRCYAHNDPLHIFESLTAGTIIDLS